jgi:hypothetical protein
MGEIGKSHDTGIGKYCNQFWKLDMILTNCISEFNHWDKTGSIENLRYGIFWHKIPMVLFRENIKIYNFLLKLLVSNHFKPIVPFCARVLPIVTTWNLVLLCESCGKSRLCFGKTIWNWVFLSETGGKLKLCFGKMIWNRVFLCEIGKKLR